MTHGTAQVGTLSTCAVLLFSACTAGPKGDSGLDPTDAPPSITEASVSCDTEVGRWTFEATTDAWTGNGQVLLSADGEYVEKHTMYSVSSAADGSADHLKLQLSVVPDWRDVSLGSSTVFNCNEPELAGILRVFTRDGAAQGDCRAFGNAPERWAGWNAGATCEALLETPTE